MTVAQIIMATWLLFFAGAAWVRHGKRSTTTRIDATPALIVVTLQAVVLVWGGFWS